MPERITPDVTVDRRTVLKRGLALGLSSIPLSRADAASTSATPIPESQPSSYKLTQLGNKVVDKEMFLSSEKGIKWLEFSYDPNHSGGSLEVGLCTNSSDEVTLLGREVKPNKGYLFNYSFAVDTTCINQYPATYLQVLDVEEVLIGQGKDENGNYKDMRRYRITREEKGLSGEFTGLETVDPKTIKMRDEGVAAG